MTGVHVRRVIVEPDGTRHVEASVLGSTASYRADQVLVALGRGLNTDRLGLGSSEPTS